MTEKEILDLRLKFSELSIVSVKKYTYSRSWKKPVYIKTNKLLFITEGDLLITLNANDEIIKSGQVALIPEGSMVDIVVDKGTTSVVYECEFRWTIQEDSVNRYLQWNMSLYPKTRGKMERLFDSLVRYENPQNIIDIYKRLGIFIELIKYLLPDLEPIIGYKGKKRGVDLTEIACYIDNIIITENISVKKLAQKVSMSERNFQRLYKEQFGMTCRDYIATKQMEGALYMLKYTNVSMSDIAAQYRFSNGASFARFVKKHTGSTPVEIRRSHIE